MALKKLELLEKPEAHVFWAFGADVVLVATDRAGNTYHIDLPTWQEARQLAEDIHRASLAAEELDKGWMDAEGAVSARELLDQIMGDGEGF